MIADQKIKAFLGISIYSKGIVTTIYKMLSCPHSSFMLVARMKLTNTLLDMTLVSRRVAT